jgi:hypothetical protein
VRASSLAMLAAVIGLLGAAGCDKSGPLANVDASNPWQVPSSVASAGAASTPDAGPPDAGRVMPPRPVPTSSPTVLITMPLDVQLRAIQYMAAMQAPQPDDAPADPDYSKTIADALRGFGKPDVISSGRLIEVKMDKGCDATLPKQAIARSTGATPGVLLAHGVLVVKCFDKHVQCLQSTRDSDDVLCTRK